MKILTIVVPVYNTEKYIIRCLDSFLDKEIIDDIEIIIVSDGSKDNSVNLAKKYETLFPNTFRIVEKENGGHGSTINVGLKLATGKYFKVVDSDDWVNTVDFVKLIKKLKECDSDLVVTNYRKELVYKGDEETIIYTNLKDSRKYEFDNFALEILKGDYFVMATSTYKTSVLRESKIKLMEKTFYVDMQYNVIPILNVSTFVFYDLDIYRYFIGRKDQSVNTKSFVNHSEDHDRVIKFLINFYMENNKNISLNKKKYIKMIINYMLYTHYSIYCLYYENKKKGYKNAREFDTYLKNKSEDLYKESNISFIKIYRRFSFVPILILFNCIKTRMINVFKKVGRKK